MIRSSLILGAALLAFGGAASAETLSQAVSSGRYDQAAVQQLLAGSGLTYNEAQSMTISEIAQKKWKDD
ncbi:hypothetical protein [Amaricoccus sp.]|uniref:hypothetical protein n=1 Tax=Amaricoccus sp. TaxID=1872485 RepID=UPI001B4D33EF|nr:hypothetical protein [Amaricoccus sp.]MBP7003215.1 hypothetical protein [Amaricoccus sp.]